MDLVFLEVCDCVITGFDDVVVFFLRLKDSVGSDVETDCCDHFSFYIFLTFAFLASFKAHSFCICRVRGNNYTD